MTAHLKNDQKQMLQKFVCLKSALTSVSETATTWSNPRSSSRLATLIFSGRVRLIPKPCGE